MKTDRRQFLSASTLALGALSFGRSAFAASAGAKARIPVVLATDIGGDIDDTWALGLLLKCPELDLKLAVTDFGMPQYRGKLIAKILEQCGHGHIPVGLGPEYPQPSDPSWDPQPQADWVKDYRLDKHPGKVFKDGAKAMVDTIMNSPQPITVISVGPMPTVAAALALEPKIAQRARFVGMYGSVRVGYDGSKTPSKEANVVAAVKPAKAGLSAPWDITITPLDTCGLVKLTGERYQRLLKSQDPVAKTVIENYRLWASKLKGPADMADKGSSVLFDTVAVYLAFARDLCKFERLNIGVTDDGMTVIDPKGKPMDVATEWKNLDGFNDFLVERLTGTARSALPA